MSSESMVRDMFRSLEATIHERLSMIADLIHLTKTPESETVSDKLSSVLESIQTIDARLTNLEMKKTEAAETVHVNHIGKLSPDIWTVSAMPGLEINLNEPPKDHTIPIVENVNMEDVVEEAEEEEEVEEEVVEEEAVEEEVVEEEAVEEEAEEEEEGESVEQFTYKNKNYYRDSSNQVYAENADGEPDDAVVGIWDATRERILFKRI
jgi:hypothetical protein